MKIKHVVLFCLTALLFACENNKKAADEITGVYYGVLPCADCPGIYYELNLNEDFTFLEKSYYLDAGPDTFKVSGSFRIKPDSIIVLSAKPANGGFDQLKFSNGTLKVLDNKGNEITTELAEYYVLKTKKPEKMLQENVTISNTKSNFKATGNEPFWALKIDMENNRMEFEPMDGEKIVANLPEAVENGNKLLYEATSETSMLKVMILKEECQDNMSGERFSHKVSVTFQSSDMEKAKTFTGCGEYVQADNVPAELVGRWILNKINKTVVQNNSSYKNPTMEINASEGKVIGNGGCNRYSGSIKSLGENKISISKVMSTKMACPGMDMEMKYFEALTAKSLTYKLSDSKLIFYNNENTLVFEEVE